MRNLRVWNSAVLGVYGVSILLLACLFFAHELRYTPYQGSHLSEDFMVRFSAFWFVSFLLTILVYLFNLSLNYLWLPRAEKNEALQAGKLIFSLGLVGALIAVIIFSVLTS
jgi:uncharacterized BrkB/YihY/UPF0761 family membrane protein